MRYSFVLATLAASAIATPYINVEVSEPGELAENNHHNKGHGLKRHHRHGRNDRDNQDDDIQNNGWFSSLWRKNRGDNDRDGHRGRRGDRRGRDDDRDNGDDDNNDDDEDFHSNGLMDDLFGADYECVIQATSNKMERKDARECCREIGGELYDIPGRCVFRDVYENPREDWRTCAMEQAGAVFADCYYREQREVDDELSSRRRNSQSRSRSRDDEDRERRNRRHGKHGNHNGRNDRNDRNDRDKNRDNDRNDRDRDNGDRQIFLGRDDQDNSGRTQPDDKVMQCEIYPRRSRDRNIAQMCCDHANGKPSQDSKTCELRGEDELENFEDCTSEHRLYMRCHSIDDREEF